MKVEAKLTLIDGVKAEDFEGYVQKSVTDGSTAEKATAAVTIGENDVEFTWTKQANYSDSGKYNAYVKYGDYGTVKSKEFSIAVVGMYPSIRSVNPFSRICFESDSPSRMDG